MHRELYPLSTTPIMNITAMIITMQIEVFETYYAFIIESIIFQFQRRQWQPAPVLLVSKTYRMSLVGCSPSRVAKSSKRYSNSPLLISLCDEKKMRNHPCSCLRIRWDRGIQLERKQIWFIEFGRYDQVYLAAAAEASSSIPPSKSVYQPDEIPKRKPSPNKHRRKAD